jgi:hypothetical protein
VGRITAEQLNESASVFTFKEEEVTIEELGGTILVRELAAGRRAKLLKGLLDEDGNVRDVMEFQCRMFAAACIDPQMKTAEVRKFLPNWPSSKADLVLDVAGKLGGNKKEEEAKREAEFQDES